jgi:hypothetical protein
MTAIILISAVWFAALVAMVVRLATRQDAASGSWERSPRLLAGKHPSFDEAIRQVLQAMPRAKSSKPATAEHVGDRAQKDLYVRP